MWCTFTPSTVSPGLYRSKRTPPQLGSEHGMGSSGFRLSYADNVGVLARCEKMHFSSSRTPHCFCKESRSRCARHIPWQRMRGCGVTRTRKADSLFSRADGLSAPSHWRSRSGQGSREAPGRVRFAPSRQMSIWIDRVRTKMRCLLPRQSRADFPSVSLQLVDPSEWKLAAYGGFWREENVIVLEARSILYALRYAESNYPPGRLLILPDNLALVLALCKGRSQLLHCFQFMRRIFASGFRVGIVLSFRWIPSVVSLTVLMTRANPFFMSLHSA